MSVVYLLWRYPELTHTFVYREIAALHQVGVPVSVWAWEVRGESPLLAGTGIPVRTFPRHPLYLPMLAAFLAVLLLRPLSTFRALRWGLRHLPLKDVIKGFYLGWRLRRDRSTALHAHFATEAAELAYVAHLVSEVPWGLTLHGADLFCPRPSVADLVRGARWVCTVSHYNQRHIAATYGLQATVVRCIPGVGGDAVRSRAVPTLLTVARCIEKKGLDVVLRAALLLKGRGVAFEWEVVGEGPLRARLARAAAEAGVGDVLRFSGPAQPEELEARYAKGISAFVFSGRIASSGDRDGVPVAMLDAMAWGVPVVATAVSGVAEALGEPPAGWLVPADDPSALADAIEALLADGELARARGEEGKGRVLAAYNPARTAADLLAVLGR